MHTSTVTELYSKGFESQHCPATRQVMPNMTRVFKGYYISYAGYISEYGCATTALVLQGRVFMIINGNHALEMIEANEKSGIDGCVDVFIKYLAKVNHCSEHMMALGLIKDLWSLMPTAVEVLGQNNMDRITAAISTQAANGN